MTPADRLRAAVEQIPEGLPRPRVNGGNDASAYWVQGGGLRTFGPSARVILTEDGAAVAVPDCADRPTLRAVGYVLLALGAEEDE